MKSKKVKSTCEELIESMSKKEKKKYFEEYQELLLSELILAKRAKDDASVEKLTKLIEEIKSKYLKHECDPSESVWILTNLSHISDIC